MDWAVVLMVARMGAEIEEEVSAWGAVSLLLRHLGVVVDFLVESRVVQAAWMGAEMGEEVDAGGVVSSLLRHLGVVVDFQVAKGVGARTR